ncbi:MAG: hypothetical protein ABUM26_06525 [Solirubrobacterales bacterium]
MALSREVVRKVAMFVPPLIVALVALPFVLRQNAWWEWTTAYWLLERQAEHVSAHGIPTLYLHTNDGTFYPFYVFYGGFTLSLLAYPAALFGAWPVYVATCIAAPVVGYLGIWWTARNLGLSHRLAVLPGLAFAATPYLVADLYGRSSWAELMAVNLIPLLLGALSALLWHPERGPIKPMAALCVAAAVIAGTHNVTVLLTAIVLPLLMIALLPLVPCAAGALRARFVARQLGLSALAIAVGAGLTGAWLVPNLWFGRETWAAQPAVNDFLRQTSVLLNSFTSVLSPTPSSPQGSWVYAQPPVLPLIWAVVALAVVVVMHRRNAALVATSTALIALGGGLVLLVVRPLWWSHFPDIVQTVQNPIRLLPYVALVGVVGIIVALTTLSPGRMRVVLISTLVIAVGAQVYMAARIAIVTQASSAQPAAPLRHGDVTAISEPPAYAGPRSFPTNQFRVIKPTPGSVPKKNAVVYLTDPLTSDAGVLEGKGNVGDRLVTSLVWSHFIRVDGDLQMSGRSLQGNAIATITRTRSDGRWAATVSSVCSGLCLDQLKRGAVWQMAVGRLLTLLSALVILTAIAFGLRRRSPRAVAEPADAGPVAAETTPAPAAP